MTKEEKSMANTEKYPATSYDRDLTSWEITAEPISQVDIPRELRHAEDFDLLVCSGPLSMQQADGSRGPEVGALSVVWGSAQRADGTRTVLGWYESSR